MKQTSFKVKNLGGPILRRKINPLYLICSKFNYDYQI